MKISLPFTSALGDSAYGTNDNDFARRQGFSYERPSVWDSSGSRAIRKLQNESTCYGPASLNVRPVSFCHDSDALCDGEIAKAFV
jgi:hypothetical protein